MCASFRVSIGVLVALSLFATSPAFGQIRRRWVPGVRPPVYTYPYRTYRPIVPVPLDPPLPAPAAPSSWTLGVMGTDWPGVGVRIVRIEAQSSAERMGIRVGDTIVQVNELPVRSMYDLRSALAASRGYLRVLVFENRTNSYVWHSGSLASAGPQVY